MMSLLFMLINSRSSTRSFTRCVMRWIWNVKSNGISYSWYFFMAIYFKNIIWFWFFSYWFPDCVLYPDKQGTPEEGRRIQWLKRCVSINHNKDKNSSPKNHNQINTHQASCPKFWQIRLFLEWKLWDFIIEVLLFISKIGDRSRGWPEGSLFDSYYTKLLGRALLLSLDCFTLLLIRTL